jgi:hypothetical protein
MSIARRTEARQPGSADPVLWALAAVLSLGSLWLPTLVSVDGDRFKQALIVDLALLSTGALFGCMRPGRAWRWAVAGLAAFVLRDLVGLLSGLGFTEVNLAEVTSLLVAHAGRYCLDALIVFLGALAGSLMMRAGLD